VADVTVAAALAAARARGVDRLDAELLLARATGFTRTQLLAADDRALPAAAAATFEAWITRRAGGEPYAYLTGERGFWTLDLAVTPDVLVPRPETELLVERCLAALPAGGARVADLGTGSGAIALALASERPRWTIIATDASPAALAVAAGNARRLGLANVEFRHGSWCTALHASERFDAIVSNPPYIAGDDPALPALRFEPRAALVAGDDGYADLLAIADGAAAHLLPGGRLLLEHGAAQAARLRGELVARGYARVVCHPDLAGRDRVTEASRS
jgi:release factor glutamine methyltransferase